MPAVRTDTGIEWVDLDLDYRVHLDERLEQLDAEEYHAHIASMGYPADVQEQVQAACIESSRCIISAPIRSTVPHRWNLRLTK
jgi:protein associated with RNAse G/E